MQSNTSTLWTRFLSTGAEIKGLFCRTQAKMLIRAGSGDRRDSMASNLRAMVFQSWETEVDMVGLHHNNVKNSELVLLFWVVRCKFTIFWGFLGYSDLIKLTHK